MLGSVIGRDFQSSLDRWDLERLAAQRGMQVWKGELAVEQTLNTDVTTAFPVDQAIGTPVPGIYVMVGQPAGATKDEYEALATQWFIVSDIGLTAFSGNDGIHAFVHSLDTARPKRAIEIRLMSRGNEILARKRSSGAGYVHFEANLTRGEGASSPAMLIAAEDGGDYAFLNLKAPAFDLSDRGVSGRTVPAGLDAFVYAERGVYRSGETVQVTALLRDGRGIAALGLPVTLVVERPDGVEYRRSVVADQGLGGRSLAVALVPSAPTGTWRVRAFADPKGPPVGEATFMVEDYVPDRLELDLASAAGSVSRSVGAEITVEGRYLYGAPAAGLGLEGELFVRPVSERAGFARYQFGLADEEAETVRAPIEGLPQTDVNGKARFPVAIEKQPPSTRPLEAQVTLRMAEPGGRAIERKLTLPVIPDGPMIGVRPLFSGRSLGEGEQATFDVIVVDPVGRQLARQGLRYELLRIETRYQWYRRDGVWDFEPVKTTRRVADGEIDANAETPARIAVPVQWGRYRLEVATADRDGPVTSIAFDAGWYASADADTPDMLEVALDKPEYAAGEVMTVAVTARTAGKVTVNVISDRLVATVAQDVPAGTARIRVPVGSDWGTGAYLIATFAVRSTARPCACPAAPSACSGSPSTAGRARSRVDLTLPPLIRPNSALRIPVKVGGLASGEEARLVVAAVDVGILNLTGYKPPAPDDHYLGQRRLTTDVRDLYGQLIDGMQGTRGQIRAGGDAAAELQGPPPSQKPLALYSGIVTVKPDGTAEVAFDVPDFNGTVRVMAVAWSKDKVGRGGGEIVVRDPVVITATLPRFLNNGDRGSMHLEIDNVEGGAGDYRLEVTGEGVVWRRGAANAQARRQAASLDQPPAGGLRGR